MSGNLSDLQLAELRGELAELRADFGRRLDEVDQRLSARMRMVEAKHASDIEALQSQITSIASLLAALARRIGTVESLTRANHMSQIHLWGVTARYLKVPEDEIASAQRKAESELNAVPRE